MMGLAGGIALLLAAEGAPALSPVEDDRTIALALLERTERVLDSLTSYVCVIENMVRSMDKSVTERKTLHYTWVRPGHIRIRILEGGKGEIYLDPETGKVRARLPGMLSFLRVTLDPRDPRLTDPRGFHVSESSWFHMIRTWKKRVQEAPEVRVRVRGDTLIIETAGLVDDPHGEYRTALYLSDEIFLPLGARAWDQEGDLVHEAWFREVERNTVPDPERVRF